MVIFNFFALNFVNGLIEILFLKVMKNRDRLVNRLRTVVCDDNVQDLIMQ